MLHNANFVILKTLIDLATGQLLHNAKLFRASIMSVFASLAHARTVAAEYKELERRGVPPGELLRWLSERL